MSSLRLRHRHRLRRKDISGLASELRQTLGCDTFSENDVLETADSGQYRLIILRGEAVGIYFGDEPFLTIRGLLAYAPTKRYVTVDMGAVSYVANGADIMVPGVIDADPSIKAGNGVWIRDEKNNRPLAIGIALMDANEMISTDKGKAVDTVHYVGDRIWTLGEG